MRKTDFWNDPGRLPPVSRFGRQVKRPKTKGVIYKGGPLPAMIAAAGGDPFAIKAILRSARVGDPFAIPVGMRLEIPEREGSMRPHREG